METKCASERHSHPREGRGCNWSEQQKSKQAKDTYLLERVDVKTSQDI